MARRASKKETKAEQQARTAAKFKAGEIQTIEREEVGAVEDVLGAKPSDEVIILDPTPEGIELMKRAIAEGKTARFRGEAEHTDEEVDAAEKAANAEDGENEVVFVQDPEVFNEELAAEQAEEEKKSGGVVKDVFKKRYVEQAVARGDTSKHAKRSNWDWLAQQLATFCLKKDGKIDIGAFTDVLDANGVDHSKWKNRNRGWEGRFRMTGRVALQKIVATAGELKWPGDAEPTPAPKEWCDTILKRQA